MKDEIVTIVKVIRNSDGKKFSIGDTVMIEDCFHGVIDGMQQFDDDFRVHLYVDEDSGDVEYWSITELD